MGDPGHVYKDVNYPASDGPTPKYIVLLCQDRAQDWICVLTTSRQHGRPENPPCNHAMLPSFFVGEIEGVFELPTWIDLMRPEVEDSADFEHKVSSNQWEFKGVIPRHMLCEILDCAAGGEDFDSHQISSLRDTLSNLR